VFKTSLTTRKGETMRRTVYASMITVLFLAQGIMWPGELKDERLFLPSYSPNLNLIERLWRFVKKSCLYSRH